MIEQQDRLARERQEIATRVANFRATQRRFQQEREEYCETTLENARNGAEPKSPSQDAMESDALELAPYSTPRLNDETLST